MHAHVLEHEPREERGYAHAVQQQARGRHIAHAVEHGVVGVAHNAGLRVHGGQAVAGGAVKGQQTVPDNHWGAHNKHTQAAGTTICEEIQKSRPTSTHANATILGAFRRTA